MKRLLALLLIICMLGTSRGILIFADTGSNSLYSEDTDDDDNDYEDEDEDDGSDVDNNLPKDVIGEGSLDGGYASAADLGKAYWDQTIYQYEEMEEDLEQVMNNSDPISDRDLFGVYDPLTNTWSVPSMFDYESNPNMAGVKYAVMEANGNYDRAKERLKDYYTGKFKNSDLGLEPVNTVLGLYHAICRAENMITKQTAPTAVLKIRPEMGEHTVDVTGRVAGISSADSMTKQVGFTLAALKKDGYRAWFTSKEYGDEEQKPYIQVTVNKKVRTYYPVQDTMIVAGRHKQTAYGDEVLLGAEESYSTIGIPLALRADPYTSRAYYLFEFPDINPGDTVSNAVMHLFGYMEESENPVSPEIEKTFKDVIVLGNPDLAWDENQYTWQTSVDKEKTISYDGEYGIFKKDMDTGNAIGLYNAYGEKAFAYLAMRELMSRLVRSVEDPVQYIEGHNKLSLSNLNNYLPDHLADLMDSEFMTPERFTWIIKYVYKIADRAVRQWGSNEETNNWGISCAVGVLSAAMFWQEFVDANLPMTKEGQYGEGRLGGWREVGKHRMEYTAGKFLQSDGACIEISLNYTQYCVSLFNKAFSLAEKCGLDIRKYISEQTIHDIRQYFLFMIDMMNPIGGGFQQGHATNYDRIFSRQQNWRTINGFLNDPLIKWQISNKTIGSGPEYTSVAYDVAARAVLRSDWSENATAMQIQADGGQPSHGNNDDLSVSLYANNNYLLVDPMQENYTTSQPVTAWLHSTRAHNTIEINDVSQRGAANFDVIAPDGQRIQGEKKGEQGNLHPQSREFNGIYNYIKAETYGYQKNSLVEDDFTVTRDVLFVEPEYFIVTDYLKPQTDTTTVNKYSQYWHMLPNANMAFVNGTKQVRSNFANNSNIIVAPVEQQTAFVGDILNGWYQSSSIRALYARYTKQAAGAVTFNTVLYPEKTGQSVKVNTQNITLDVPESVANSFWFTAKNDTTMANTEAYYYTLLDKEYQTDRAFGKYATDGTLSLVQKKNDLYNTVIVKGATYVKEEETNKDVVRSKFPISDLGIVFSGNEILMETSKAVLFDKIEEGEDIIGNIALGKSGESSPYYQSNGVSLAFDGNPNTAWSGVKSSGEKPWLMVDLENRQNVSEVVIYDNQKDLDYEILYSIDGSRWEPVANKDSQNLGQEADFRYKKTYSFNTVECRYVKMEAKESAALNIWEAELYRYGAAINLEGMHIYAPNKVDGVKMNNQAVPFIQDGDYVIITQEDSTNDGNNNESDNPHNGNGPSNPKKDVHGSPQGSGISSGGNGGGEIPPIKPDFGKFEEELKGHWGKAEIEDMIQKGMVTGSGDGLKLQENITRAEFTALLVRALKLETVEYDSDFEDILGNEWYAHYISTAKSAGLFSGSDGRAQPNDIISREQMAKMLVEAYQFSNHQAAPDFTESSYLDQHEISQWAVGYVSRATALALLKGMDNNQFLPRGSVLREQAFVAVYRLINQLK